MWWSKMFVFPVEKVCQGMEQPEFMLCRQVSRSECSHRTQTPSGSLLGWTVQIGTQIH